ncbi:BCCT family transporter [Mariniblastus sp.]|nr:BCCT family transporter [Mariniblastus sp.]
MVLSSESPKALRDDSKSNGVFSGLNHFVFWPPFLLLLSAIVLNFSSPDRVVDGDLVPGQFSTVVNAANTWVLDQFGWLFSACAFFSVMLCIAICCTAFWQSGFASVRIGGPDAKPLMSIWNWFSITICTTIAIGILFWSTAEPIDHLTKPPEFANVEAGSRDAAVLALSTMYLHWSFTPYSLYCVASLMFAFAFYNMKQPFTLGATLTPLFGRFAVGPGSYLIDAICLYSLVAGMAAGLGSGILMINGGLHDLWGVPNANRWVLGGIAFAIVFTFVISSATGLMKGIRILSDLNTRLLLGLAIVPLLFVPTFFLVSLGGEALWDYVTHFLGRNLAVSKAATGELQIFAPDEWSKGYTVFYWAVWMAWAPITACFLGRIAYGRTVKEFMLVNFIFPSIFAIGWMTIFSGTALYYQMEGHVDLAGVIATKGHESVSIAVLNQFPFAVGLVMFYLLSAFICFVTSSDSNMSAMSSVSSTGISPDNPEGNPWLKIVWGVTVGMVAWIMICFAGGVKGVKMLSTLGGLPAAFLELFIIAALLRVVFSYRRLDRFAELNSSRVSEAAGEAGGESK